MPLLVYVVVTFIPLACVYYSERRENVRIAPEALLLFFIIPLITLAGKTALIPSFIGTVLCALVLLLITAWRGASLLVDRRASGGSTSALLLLPIIVLIGFLLGTVTHSPDYGSFAKGLPTFVALLLAVLIAVNVKTRERFLQAASKIIPITAFGSLVLVIYSPEVATISTSTISASFAPDGRLSGPLLHPNALGTMCAIGLILTLTRNKGIGRIAGVTVCLLAIMLTDQRSAQLSVAIGITLYLVLLIRRSQGFWFVVTIGVVSAAIAALSGALQIIEDLFGRRTQSLSVRQDIYDYVYQNLDEILPFGLGPTGLYEATNRTVFINGVAHAHNTWLSMFVIGGLLSGVAFLIMSVWCLISLIREHAVSDMVSYIVVVLISLSEAPTIAGSNWTIVPVAMIATLAFMPLLKSPNSEAIIQVRVRTLDGDLN